MVRPAIRFNRANQTWRNTDAAPGDACISGSHFRHRRADPSATASGSTSATTRRSSRTTGPSDSRRTLRPGDDVQVETDRAGQLNYNVRRSSRRISARVHLSRATRQWRLRPAGQSSGRHQQGQPGAFPESAAQGQRQRPAYGVDRTGSSTTAVLRQRERRYVLYFQMKDVVPRRAAAHPSAIEHVDGLQVPGNSGLAAAAQRLHRQSRRARRPSGTTRPLRRQRRRHPLAAGKGQHALQGRHAVRAHRQRRPDSARRPDVTLNWNASRNDARRPAGARHLRLLHVTRRSYTDGDIHANNIGFFVAGRVDDQQPADAEPRRAHRERGRFRPTAPRTPASSSASATRSRRASASPTTSRATASGRRTAAGASSTTSRSSRCRAACWRRHWITTTTRSTRPTGRRSTAAARPAAGCPGTFIEQVDFRHVVERSRTTTWSIRTSSRSRRRSSRSVSTTS